MRRQNSTAGVSGTKLESVEVAVRELAERRQDGVVVRLLWNDSAPPGQDVFVEYQDEQRAIYFDFYPPHDRVLEAFYHPELYAARAETLVSDTR